MIVCLDVHVQIGLCIGNDNMELEDFIDISSVILTSLLLLLITICYLFCMPPVNNCEEEYSQNHDKKRKLNDITIKKQKVN